jgi:cell division septum initiation protein DivIVA
MVTELDGYRMNGRLTPEVLRSASFSPARLGRRGLDEASVREFCAWTADEVVRLLNERANLEAEVLRLRDRVLGRAAPEDGEAQAVSILAKAQQTADQYVASAQVYGKEVASDARRYGEEILNEARARASVILDQAHARAAQAAQAAPAAASGREPMGAEERRDLETELIYLRTYSEVCRTHLRAYLDSLSRSIAEWEQAEKSGVAAIVDGSSRS